MCEQSNLLGLLKQLKMMVKDHNGIPPAFNGEFGKINYVWYANISTLQIMYKRRKCN